MSPQNEDFIFAQEAQTKGYVTEEQVEEAFLLQKRMAEELKIDERLAVILVKRGWMAEEQARRVYALLEPEGKRIRIEGYRLVERVGRGSMGTVYKAIHEGLHRVVAIKVLRRELLGEKVHTERLKNEARMLAELEHPHIVRALDAGESNGFPYVVMEFVEGETLKDRIARVGALDEDEALRIARGVADALEKARRMGVVHRDVKPGNILISQRGVAKLMDLGLAKGPVDMELTQHGATVGTPQFMAPEQVEEAGAVDSRSDIYGLGATMYAMLTGRPPFTGTSMAEILNKVLNEQAIPIRALTKVVSPEVSYLVERMMLKDPSLRFQTPVEVVNQVDRILGGQSIIPEGFKGNWEGFLLRQRQRRRRKLAGVVGIIIALIAGGAFLMRSAAKKEEARTRAVAFEQDLTSDTDVRTIASQAELERRLADVRRTVQQLAGERRRAGLDVEVPSDIEQRVRRLEAYRDLYEAYTTTGTGERARAQRQAGNRHFRTARDALGEFLEGIDADFIALRGEITAQRNEIFVSSEEAWREVVRGARTLTAASLAEYVKRMTARRDALVSGDFVVLDASGRLSELDRTRELYRNVVQRLQDVAKTVGTFGATFDRRRVLEARVAAWDKVGVLRGEMARAVQATVRTARGFLGGDGWDGAIPTERVMALVSPALADRVRAFDELVSDAASQELTQINTLVAQGRLLEAEGRGDATLNALGPTYFSSARTAMEAVLKEVQGQIRDLRKTADAYVRDAARAVLLRLREGDRPGAEERIRRAINDRPPALKSIEKSLMALWRAPEAVDAVHDAALRHLAGPAGRARREVVLYDEQRRAQEPVRARIDEVDAKLRRVKLRVFGARSSGSTTAWIGIGDIELARLERWTRDEPGVDDGQRALARLVAVAHPTWTTGRDLRPLLQTLGEVLDGLSQFGYEPWLRYARRVRGNVFDANVARESQAISIFGRFTNAYSEGLYVVALDLGVEYLDPKAVWHFTDHVDENREFVSTRLAKCREEAKKREIERWVRGFRAESEKKKKRDLVNGGFQLVETGRTAMRCDFDNEVCLKQFSHGFARLVKEKGSIVTTPDPTARERKTLELLPGVEGILRGRQLTFRHMPFDAADRIEMSFTLETLKGAFFLAFDIDGVQLGVLSADPNWFTDWLLPPEVRRDGDSAVLNDFYGRGRGIALHDGPDFGRIAAPPHGTWTWLDRQRGRHHGGWAGRGEGTGELFAFRPAHRYRVKIVRMRDTITLYVADARRYEAAKDDETREKVLEQVFTHRDGRWRNRGTASEIAPGEMSKGSGKIQILSWSTVRIDDLEVVGRVREGWKQKQREAEEKAGGPK